MNKKWIAILVIFLLTVPLVMADLPKDSLEETTYKTVYDGARLIDDILKVKAAEKSKTELDTYEKSVVLKEETDKVMKKEKYPLSISKDLSADIKILAYTCDGKKYNMGDGICGYWIWASRNGQEVATNSPIWISPPPYVALIGETCYSDKDEKNIRGCEFTDKEGKPFIMVSIVKEDPKEALQQVLQGYVDRQPLGKAITGTKE